MLGKISWQAAGKLAGPRCTGPVGSITSPRSPLECKSFDQGGVGLGIVVALDKPSNITSARYGGGEILAKYAICGPFSARTSPIPVNTPAKAKGMEIEMEMEMEGREGLDEEFTYVTCHGPNKSVSSTRVYYDRGDGRNRIKLSGGLGRKVGVFKISSSPSGLFEDTCPSGSDSDFLSSCHLCRKPLHGEDIYMYRGEKAFCSAECRQRQIRIDEREEKSNDAVSRSNDVVSSSPYNYTNKDQIFSNGIIAV